MIIQLDHPTSLHPAKYYMIIQLDHPTSLHPAKYYIAMFSKWISQLNHLLCNFSNKLHFFLLKGWTPCNFNKKIIN